jgi:hypothetical protein
MLVRKLLWINLDYVVRFNTYSFNYPTLGELRLATPLR